MPKKTVYLTFDDGPDAEKTQEVLDVLQRHDVYATFFLIGKKIRTSNALVGKIKSAGHTIGNHSYAHSPIMPFWSKAKLIKDIELCNAAIKIATGQLPKLYRPPFGVTNPAIKHAVETLNLQSIIWSFRTFDTAHPLLPEKAQSMANRLKNGDIILMHDTTAGLAKFLDTFIPLCKDKGFIFATIEPKK